MSASSPELEAGGVYTLSCGGAYDGSSEDGICSGGTYSGGTELAELTLSSYLTTYGSQGMMGGRPGGPQGDWGGPPPEGARPERPPEGEDFPSGRGNREGPDGGTRPGGAPLEQPPTPPTSDNG